MSQSASPQGSRSGSGDVLASLTPIEREPVPGSVLAYAGEDAPSMLAADVLDSTEVPGLAIPDEIAAMWWPEWDDLS